MLCESTKKKLNSSGKFPRLSTWFTLQEIQKDSEERNIQPENFEDGIIFMLMFNDILWRTNFQNCFFNAEKVKNYANTFLQIHWTCLGLGSEKRWYDDSHDQQGQWDCTANKIVQRLMKIGDPIFTNRSALSRGILKQKKKVKVPLLSMEVLWNTELLFQTVHAVNQLSVYAAVMDWCYQFGFDK